MEILEKTHEMLEAHPLCDHCLGRQFALLGYGLDDQQRGKTLKLLLTMKNHQLALSGKKAGFSNADVRYFTTELWYPNKVAKTYNKILCSLLNLFNSRYGSHLECIAKK